MLPSKNLNQLLEGAEAVIECVEPGLLRKHLLEIGFTKGTLIKCVKMNKLFDLIIFRIRGSTISLRPSEASLVKIL